MSTSKLHLGLDVHKDSITLANAPSTPPREVRLLGTITNHLHALERTVTRLRKAHPDTQLEAAYEAGPCGFGIARRQEGQPKEVRALSWKAQNRLHLRFLRLLPRRLPRNKAKVAVARELCGFVWALLRAQPCETEDRAAMNPNQANRPGAILRATREYQHTNRRVNISPAATASPLARPPRKLTPMKNLRSPPFCLLTIRQPYQRVHIGN